MRLFNPLTVITGIFGLLLMSGCSSEDTSVACTPVAAASFPCTNPAECLSVTATWCFPGAASCSNVDADLSLERPDGIIIGVGNGEIPDTNGCIHDGDEQANVLDPDGDGVTGPFNENITCSPYTHAQPPDRIDPGNYIIEVEELSLLNTGEVLLDINVNGQTSCQIVNIDAGPARVEVVYP